MYRTCGFQDAFKQVYAIDAKGPEGLFGISRCSSHKRGVDPRGACARKCDVRPERAFLFLKTVRFETRVEFFRQVLHRWRFHSRPKHARRAVAGKKSDTAYGYGEGLPGQAGEDRINGLAPFLGHFTNEL